MNKVTISFFVISLLSIGLGVPRVGGQGEQLDTFSIRDIVSNTVNSLYKGPDYKQVVSPEDYRVFKDIAQKQPKDTIYQLFALYSDLSPTKGYGDVVNEEYAKCDIIAILLQGSKEWGHFFSKEDRLSVALDHKFMIPIHICKK